MAGCQARTVFWQLKLTVILVALMAAGNAYKPLFNEIPTHTLQQHIVYSRHQPFCVIFRDPEKRRACYIECSRVSSSCGLDVCDTSDACQFGTAYSILRLAASVMLKTQGHNKKTSLKHHVPSNHNWINATHTAMMAGDASNLESDGNSPVRLIMEDSASEGVGSKLEKTLYDIWRNKYSQENYTKWEVEAFHSRENKLPANVVAPRTTPAVRCYLGESSNYDYEGSTSARPIRRWLQKLDSRYSEQSIEATRQLVEEARENYETVLLAFPDNPRHYEVEDIVYRLAAEVDSCKSLTVHLNTDTSKQLEQDYGVKDLPAVAVIHGTGHPNAAGDYRVFEGLGVRHGVLLAYITASSLPAPMLTTESFEKLMFNEDLEEEQSFPPILACFYNHWNSSAASYLDAFGMTVNSFMAMGSHINYGTVNIADRSSRKLIKRYLQTGSMNVIPFLALFTKDVNGTVSHIVLNKGRPFPWIVYRQLAGAGPGVADRYGIQETVEPWGTISPHETTPLYEGPLGYACSVWSHNLTDNKPARRKVFTIKRKVPQKKKDEKKDEKKIWHEMFASETVEKKLELHKGVPLITQSTWADVIEKSHAPKHVYYKSGQWAGEVTKVALVVFLLVDCGSCQRNYDTFLDLQKSVSMIDGGAMYFVNCTVEKDLCRHHNIRGFPTIVVFRGLGWMGTSSCMSGGSQKMFANYIRMDYHGVIQTNAIMAWFTDVAANAVGDRKFEPVVDAFTEKNVRLVGTLMPRKTRFLPKAPGRDPDFYFKYECLRLICERLFSVVDCYTHYSSQIPQSEFMVKGLNLVVITITLERKDGVNATMMNFGEYLRETLESPSDTALHHFHRPHRYNIGKAQKCETDHAACVDVITDFTLDHSRLPVTPLTSDMFHTASSRLKDEELPILLAFVHPENLTASSQFMKDLTSIAYEKYNELLVMTLEANKYPAWSSSFVPYQYGRLRMLEPEVNDPYSMYRYPRLCIVRKTDHGHAAFYPPVSPPRASDDVNFTLQLMMAFVDEYLKDPDSVTIETQHF